MKVFHMLSYLFLSILFSIFTITAEQIYPLFEKEWKQHVEQSQYIPVDKLSKEKQALLLNFKELIELQKKDVDVCYHPEMQDNIQCATLRRVQEFYAAISLSANTYQLRQHNHEILDILIQSYQLKRQIRQIEKSDIHYIATGELSENDKISTEQAIKEAKIIEQSFKGMIYKTFTKEENKILHNIITRPSSNCCIPGRVPFAPFCTGK